jgi:prepilin-type N-terminal cleavage/methylation domain-containing protein/prepilin-type processing-associated H-X9-DG protein
MASCRERIENSIQQDGLPSPSVVYGLNLSRDFQMTLQPDPSDLSLLKGGDGVRIAGVSRVARCGRRSGFTILEVLVVIAIIAILVSLLLPAVQQAREGARRMQCRNNLMQIGLALGNYESAHNCLPPGSVDLSGPVQNNGTGYQFGWMVQILPHLDQENLYSAFDFSVSVYDKKNAAAVSVALPFACPSSVGRASYAACHHDVEAPIDVDNHGVMFLNSSVRRDEIHDGASHTLFAGEAGAGLGLGWASGTRDTLRNTGSPINAMAPIGARGAAPIAAPVNAGLLTVGGFNSAHAGGANFLFGDGTVRFISDIISMKVYRQLGHRSDGELPAGAY